MVIALSRAHIHFPLLLMARVRVCSDQEVVYTTGEQTDPVLLEYILMEDPMIRGAIIFHAHDHLGVLVDPQKDCVIDAGDRQKLAAFRRYIQLALDPMNMSPPPHVCIYPEVPFSDFL
ncbi:hypothetical protein EDB19DRAFT_1906145 [Suillus lakei]|nr:hypothetical protein EDB19DRAFT_1906145 [Suillus lakei]